VRTLLRWNLGAKRLIAYTIKKYHHPTDAGFLNQTLALNGILGASPDLPTVGFPFTFLEIICQLHQVQLQLSISGIATAIHHIHRVSTLSELLGINMLM
jgi:hypothetical protein